VGKRIGAILLTVLSYVLIYTGIRYLIKRFMGEDAPYSRFAATLGTLALSPRFSYENENGQKELHARWLLFRKKKKVYPFDDLLNQESETVDGEEEEVPVTDASITEETESAPLNENGELPSEDDSESAQ